MALRFCDSADHYVSADLLEKWTSSSGSTWSVSSGNGRHGSNSIRIASESASNLNKTLTSQGTWILGFAYRREAFGLTAGTYLAQFLDSGTVQCALVMSTDGVLSVYRGAGTALLAQGTTQVIRANVWHYIEVKITFHNTTGACEVRVDGVSVCSASGVNTRASANNSANAIRLGGATVVTGADAVHFDDIYMCDGSGAANNDFLGDVRVDAMLPNGEGKQ